MLPPLSDRFEAFLESNQLLQRGESVLLAVSGGADSMVMLHLFADIRQRWDLSLAVAHVNHQLRGEESDADESFVRDAARDLEIPVFVTRLDVPAYAKERRIGKQEAARRLRYQALEAFRKQSGATVIATAHHADDNAETVLLNAIRGAGIRGLAGIPIRRIDIAVIRPLLFAYRSEIESFAAGHGISYRNDSTNTTLEYRRNHLRNSVIPEIQRSGFPDIVLSLNRLAETMRSVSAKIAAEVEAIMPNIRRQDNDGRTLLSLAGIARLDPTLRDEVFLALLREFHVEPTAHRVRAIDDLRSHPPGHRLDVGKGISAYRDREWLVFGQPISRDRFEARVALGREYHFPGFRFEMQERSSPPPSYQHDQFHEFVDADTLGSALMLRTWKEGDWFVPLGMRSRKKISDFLTDRKLPFVDRQHVPVLETEGSIVWVCGLRLDDRFKLRPSTRRVVQLLYQPTPR
jgi:tRNA(Ile)-lysidine synthase